MAKDKRTYDVLVDVWNKPEPFFSVGRKLAATLPARKNPWRVGPDDKKKPTHVLAGTRQSLIAVFPDAIAIGSSAALNKSYAGKLSLALYIPASIGAIWLSVLLIQAGGYGVGGTMLTAFLGISLMQSWFVRNWLFTPQDWPIVFNRKTRRVSFLPVSGPPFWRFWVKSSDPLAFEQREWDALKTRSYKYMEATAGGKSFHDSYSLCLLWGEESNPAVLADCVRLGYEGYWEDELIWILWEHIRRYMEEGGPAIPHGEALRPRTSGRPVVYPPELMAAAGGPPLSEEAVEKLAATSEPDDANG